MINSFFHHIALVIITLLYPNPNQDRPLKPGRNEIGVVKNEKKSFDSYFIFNCRVYRNKKQILDLNGGRCFFLPDQTVFVQMGNEKVALLDVEQNIIWKKEIFVHHDLNINQERREVAIVSTDLDKYKAYRKIHSVKILNLDTGKMIFEWDPTMNRKNLEKIFGDDFDTIYKNYASHDTGRKTDAFIKINSTFIIPPNDLYPKLPFMKPGNLIVNFRNQPFITIVDRETKKVIWYHKVSDIEVNGAHSVKVLKNGNFLFSHNRTDQLEFSTLEKILFWLAYYPSVTNKEGGQRLHQQQFDEYHLLGHSKIREYNPLKNEYVWEYFAPFQFYSPYMGYSEPLPNGNILVTHITHGGAAFEITKDKKIVWEWINPDRYDNGIPKEVYRVMKVSKDLVEPFLKEDF